MCDCMQTAMLAVLQCVTLLGGAGRMMVLRAWSTEYDLQMQMSTDCDQSTQSALLQQGVSGNGPAVMLAMVKSGAVLSSVCKGQLCT